jgi:SAM-dependent methyltransferase
MSKKGYEQTGVAMTCRSFAEYERMFALGEASLGKGPILDVAAGASSFTAEACLLGYQAQAVDPLYHMSAERIYGHGQLEIETSTAKLEKMKESFNWSYYGTLERHQAGRAASLNKFVSDYSRPDAFLRYSAGLLPDLPYDNESFSLVLCSHFLFLYHEQFDYSFHLNALKELLRICKPGGEIRLYPVVTLRWEEYPHLNELMDDLRSIGAQPSLETSCLPFIPGSDKLLNVRK